MDDKFTTPISNNNWKICTDSLQINKICQKSKICSKKKEDILLLVHNALDLCSQRFESAIKELNFLQSGQLLIHFIKSSQLKDDQAQEVDSRNRNGAMKYFIDESDESEPEYLDYDEIVKRVKAENEITNRITQLKSLDVWSQNIIQKKPDPTRPSFQWDFLLKEMHWLHGDMISDKQNKRIDARRLAVACAKYIKEKEMQVAKVTKEDTIKAKRHCSILSKMVKDWWKQMEKIVLAKQKFRIDARRQEAINTHLDRVIQTTEKYTEWLTEDLRATTSGDNDMTSDEDPEFKVKDDQLNEDDDESITDEEEHAGNVEEEINALHTQNSMSLYDLLSELPAEYVQSLKDGVRPPIISLINDNNRMEKMDEDLLVENNIREIKGFESINEDKAEQHQQETTNTFRQKENSDISKLDVEVMETSNQRKTANKILQTNVDSSSEDEDFFKQESSDDNEETLLEQEQHENEYNENMTTECEINSLEKEAEIPIEELLLQYKDLYGFDKNIDENAQSDLKTMDDNNNDESSISSESERSELSSDDGSSYDSSDESMVDLGEVFNDENVKLQDDNEKSKFQGQFQEISEVALSTQPKGFTLESTDVKVQVPFLLKHSLREYQHVGLDWLAAIYEKRLNGILADEMGLGKTIQTIALLAYLACEKGVWGPHLVVVPTSVILNWELEFKRWCPGFKILTYFGNSKERRDKRKGWTKPNAFHVCITSYKLVIVDSTAFKRKKWKYIILDEAQNIKNFKSQRWQTLLTFNGQRRLLLTGTPLQNNLMELWSLMHFLMPNIFQSHREFNEWFGAPLTGMIEGSNEYNDQLVCRLHKVLRPFILRRLKKDVEKQLPQKYEHVVMCPLSKRQRFLYDDFMSLASTKERLKSGQFVSIISILMQLRKVCNHPNLFEERPILSPFLTTNDPIEYNFPKCLLIDDVYENRTSNCKPVLTWGVSSLADMALNLPKFVTEHIHKLYAKANLIEDVDTINTTDWVSLYGGKYGTTSDDLGFIPVDSIHLLKHSEEPLGPNFNHPKPKLFGLKLMKAQTSTNNSLLPPNIVSIRQQSRINRLKMIAFRNRMRCSQRWPIGPDIVKLLTINKSFLPNDCLPEISKRKTVENVISDNLDMIMRVSIVIQPVLSRGVRLNTASRPLLRVENLSEESFIENYRSIPSSLSTIHQNQLVQFPDTRLIENDCGKLQVLVTLLKQLKVEGHRCLIFTQMTRMLDVLEHFLSYHGYKYLRLDGTTKIEQRQILMEQFNKDSRIFVFILSTRSGGIGVNLTGADTVIFYDSDWNPTMDAQAQDRCHRIGQTRNVHIYRLISSMTIEENILKKANVKRFLCRMAIESGQFNTDFFKSGTLQDIFQTPTGLEDLKVEDEENQQVSVYKSSSGRTVRWRGDKSIVSAMSNSKALYSETNAEEAELEAALGEVEEESDRLAAKMTSAEAKADLMEFDESVPWDDVMDESLRGENDEKKYRLEMELQLENLNSQLNPLQRFGVNWLEQTLENTLCYELINEETQLETSKQNWELDQLKALHEDQEDLRNMEEDDMLYIYGKYDPYAAQMGELEKLLKAERLLELEEKRKQSETENLNKIRKGSQAWAQVQKQSVKRKLRFANIKDKRKFSDLSDEDCGPTIPKQRKTVVARVELPHENISEMTSKELVQSDLSIDSLPTTSSTISQTPVTSASSVQNRTPRRITRLSSAIVTSNKSPSVKSKGPDESSSIRSKGASESALKNKSKHTYESALSKSVDVYESVLSKSKDAYESALSKSVDVYESKLSRSRDAYESALSKSIDAYQSALSKSKSSVECQSIKSKEPHESAMNKSNGVGHLTLVRSKGIEESQRSFKSSQIINSNVSPNENVDPECVSNVDMMIKPINTAERPIALQIPRENGFSRQQGANTKLQFINNGLKGTNNSVAGKTSANFEVNKRPSNIQQPSQTESTNAASSTATSKQSSFKIPVKTLNGERKIFSAPLLLSKARPVFVISRKIEDENGNVYTQNLTYPINCSDRYYQISDQLTLFNSSTTEK